MCSISIPAYPEPTKIKIKMGSKVLTAEVAKTTEEIKTGLMDCTILSQDEGMVFLFKKNSIPGFWMKNTLIPLSIHK